MSSNINRAILLESLVATLDRSTADDLVIIHDGKRCISTDTLRDLAQVLRQLPSQQSEPLLVATSDPAALLDEDHVDDESPQEGFIRAGALAEMLGVTVVTVWRWAAQGKLPKPVKLSGRTTAWRIDEIRNWERQQNTEPYQSEKLLRLGELAEMLGVAPVTVGRWVASGNLPKPVKIRGNINAWRVEDIRSWMSSKRPKVIKNPWKHRLHATEADGEIEPVEQKELDALTTTFGLRLIDEEA